MFRNGIMLALVQFFNFSVRLSVKFFPAVLTSTNLNLYKT